MNYIFKLKIQMLKVFKALAGSGSSLRGKEDAEQVRESQRGIWTGSLGSAVHFLFRNPFTSLHTALYTGIN